MKKQLLFNKAARDSMAAGVNQLADAVSSTLGPCGRNVVLDRIHGGPVITKDGVSVAKEVTLPNNFENMGAQLVKSVASQANDKAGDGTTTATVLARAIYVDGLEAIGDEGGSVNSTGVKRGIDIATDLAVAHIEKLSVPCEGLEETKKVATISANGDARIGDLIAGAIEAVGMSGVVSVEPGVERDDVIEITSGMKFDRGFASPYFMNDLAKLRCKNEKSFILLIEGRLNSVQEILPLLKEGAKAGLPLLILAKDFDIQAVQLLAANQASGAINVCLVKSPGFGDRNLDMLKDIAALTGAIIVSPSMGMKIEETTLEQCGVVNSFEVTETHTVLEGTKSKVSEDAVAIRVAEIKATIDKLDEKDGYDAERLQERLAKLEGSIAIIRVGGSSEVEMKERRDRIDDALCATRAAIDKGTVAGGGTTLLRVAAFLHDDIETQVLSSSEELGFNILIDALESPITAILDNAGYEKPELGSVIHGILNSDIPNVGCNVLTGKLVDMCAEGIIDPAKVTASALIAAASIAGTMLTTEVMITDYVEPEDRAPGAPLAM